MENYIILLIIGIFTGFLAGMGMGGGTFLIPLLILFCSFSQISAQSVNLLAFIPMALVAVAIHVKNKLVCYKLGLVVSLVALVGCAFGVVILNFITVEYISILYAIFLILVGVWLLLQYFMLKHK